MQEHVTKNNVQATFSAIIAGPLRDVRDLIRHRMRVDTLQRLETKVTET